MKLITIFSIFISVLISFCSNRSKEPNICDSDIYSEYKNKFDTSFIDQFPNTPDSKSYTIFAYTDLDKNNVGMILYEYDLDSLVFAKILTKIDSLKVKAKYSTKDTCLLIVNRLETIVTKNNYEIPIVSNRNLIDQECFKSLYPIPNFVDYDEINIHSESYLGNEFIIYVLESKPGNHFDKYMMKPSTQMPQKWENGYSKGICYSQVKKTIIYWSIIW